MWHACCSQQFAKLESGNQPLTRRYRRTDRFANLSHCRNILRRNRLLTKVWTEFLDRVDILDRHSRRRTAMEIDHDIDMVTDRKPQLLKHARELAYILPPHQWLRIGNEDDLERGIATRHHLVGEINERLRIERLVDGLHIPTPEVGVHADLVSNLAPEQSIDRHPRRLAEDIPASLFQAADRAHADHAHAEKRMSIELLVDMLDVARILPNQHRSKILNRTNHRPGLPLERRLTPPEQPSLVGDHLHEDPIPHLRVDHNRSYIRNSHRGVAIKEMQTADLSTTNSVPKERLNFRPVKIRFVQLSQFGQHTLSTDQFCGHARIYR